MSVQGFADDGEELLRRLKLDGKKLDANILGALTQDGPLRRSISEPTSLNLTVQDPDRLLAIGGYFERRADVELDDLWFRLVRAEKAGDQFALEFIDREIALLARHTKAKRVSRADSTRAEFLRSLVREEPQIPFVCPELHRRQPITEFSKEDQRQLDRDRERGIHHTAGLTVKGRRATPEQIRNANTMLRAAVSVNAGPRATLAMLAAAIIESELRNIQGQGADSISFGVLQNIPGRSACVDGTMTRERALNVGYTARSALQAPGPTSRGGLIKLSREHKDWSIGQLASAAINGGGDPQYVPKVNGRHDEAKKFIDAFGGIDAGPDSDTGGGAYVAPYEYTRGQPGGEKGEDTWACGTRLAEEVAWRWFCVAGAVYFISDYELVRSMPRMVLNEQSPGVNTIDWAIDDGKRIPDTLTLTGRAGRWAAPPGTVVVMDSSMSPADGAWIVTEIERPSLTNPEFTATLTRPVSPKREPASQVVTRSGTGDGTNAGDVRNGTAYPLRGKQGSIIGVPHSGTHTLGNWQSDNAVDIGVPVGTIVQAVRTGKVVKVRGSYSGGTSRFDGYQVTIDWGENQAFYTHLSKVSVSSGDSIRAGQAIGRSGAANGVPHLHFAIEHGDPRTLIGRR